MATVTADPVRNRELNDPEMIRRVNALRQIDNWTGWVYLAREYFLLAAVIGTAIVFHQWLLVAGHSWLWAIPVAGVAIGLVGAGQHRLVTLTHEAAHYMLFKNRKLNELVSEWFCMYPVLGTTHNYRVQHLGHHQFPNDPEKDPDTAQMVASGHRFEFPMSRGRFLWHCVIKQILVPLFPVRYILARARYIPDGGDGCMYRLKRKPNILIRRVTALTLIGLLVGLTAGVWYEQPILLAVLPVIAGLGLLAFYRFIPDGWYEEWYVKNDFSPRFQKCLRGTFHVLLFSALACLTYLTAMPWWAYYLVLWVVPLGTSFAYFMILRQIVQHGNGNQGRFTNTRIFLVNRLISAAVFPIGNDYHLPHHLFPMVPHYNLKKLHQLLMESAEYRQQAKIVEGYFFPKTRPPVNPTVVDVMTTPVREE